MVILHVVNVMNPKGNGVAVAVSNYIESQKCFADIAIYNLGAHFDVNGDIFNIEKYESISNLPVPFNKPDLVVFNEVYKLEYIKLYKWLLEYDIPYIIIPHGCLAKQAQGKKRIKKIIGNLVLFNKFISNAKALQFLTEDEKSNSGIYGKKTTIISGNGIDIKNIKIQKIPKDREIIYIGRYDIYHKGLDRIVEVCAKYKKWFKDNDVSIVLYGRDTNNGRKNLQNQIRQRGLGDILKIKGPAYNDEKAEVLNKAYGFIQCSRFEGQPMGIIEALGYSVPCIVTKGTNLGEYVESNNCGLYVGDDCDSIFNGVQQLFLNPKSRELYSKNARKCAVTDFDSIEIAKRTTRLYQNIEKGIISDEK